jgi:putative flippase GtrA
MRLALAFPLVRVRDLGGSPAAAVRYPQLSRDLLVYLVIGGIAAAANLTAGWVLYHGLTPLRIPYWSATTTAAVCGLVVNFLLNHCYFQFGERSALCQFGTFAIVSSFGAILTGVSSQALLAPARLLLSHQPAGMHILPEFVAHVAAVGLVVLYSFPAHRFISFNVGIRVRLRQLVRGVQ